MDCPLCGECGWRLWTYPGIVMEKLVIAVGITGSRITRDQTPYIPILPEEIARSGIEAWKAGASVLHVHVRDPKTGLGTQDRSIFEEVVDRIRAETDALLCLTTSGIPGRNLPIEERLQPLALKPEFVSFDAGSINLGGSVFINTPEFLETLAKRTLGDGDQAGARSFRHRDGPCLHPIPGSRTAQASPSLSVCPWHALWESRHNEVSRPFLRNHPMRFDLVCDWSGGKSTFHGCGWHGDGRACSGWTGGQHLLFKGCSRQE